MILVITVKGIPLMNKLLEEETRKILKWISTILYEKHHKDAMHGLLDDTGIWLLDHPEYSKWLNSPVSTILWLHGIRKTILPKYKYKISNS
jgi:hypothetical protein